MQETLVIEDRLAILRETYQNSMPFNRLLDIRIVLLTPEEVQVRLDMREELVGNFIRGILHGGVISSVLDLTGGLITSVELLKQLEYASADEVSKKLTRLSTIDLRVDYLRAGEGEFFLATGTCLRRGNRVAVIRTELRNDRELLIAAGTGTYRLG